MTAAEHNEISYLLAKDKANLQSSKLQHTYSNDIIIITMINYYRIIIAAVVL